MSDHIDLSGLVKHDLTADADPRLVKLMRSIGGYAFAWIPGLLTRNEQEKANARDYGEEAGATLGRLVNAIVNTPAMLYEQARANTRKAYAETAKIEAETRVVLAGTPALPPTLDADQALDNPRAAEAAFREAFKREVVPVLELLRAKYGHASVEFVDGKPVYHVGFDPISLDVPERAGTIDGEASS